MNFRRLTLSLGLAIALASMSAPPAHAGAEHEMLQAVANLSRLAMGTPSCDPSLVDPTWVFGPPPAAYLTGGTPNQKILARVWNYGWARWSTTSTAQQKADSRTALLNFLNDQHTYGHYTAAQADEVLTSSHFQLWGAAIAGAYQLALPNSRAALDADVRDAARRWWASERALWDRLVINGQIDAPGARFPNSSFFGPNNLRDDVYRMLNGQNPNQVRTCADDKYYTVSWILRWVNTTAGAGPALGQPVSGETATPRIRQTLCIYKLNTSGEWAFYFPVLTATDPLYWVQHRLPEGRTYAGLPPNPIGKPRSFTGAAPTTHHVTGLISGAASCPSPSTLGN